MIVPTRFEFVSRDAVLKLLTDEETTRVSTAETRTALAEGAEYLDLEQLDQGVQRARTAVPIPMSDIIPRTAVSDQTWTRILAHLEQGTRGAAVRTHSAK